LVKACTQRRPKGHTLLELTIAMALGLVITMGTVELYRSQRAAFTAAADQERMREAGMAALVLIGEQIQMAGFAPATVPAGQLGMPLFGCAGARPVGPDDALTCEALASGSDGLAVRYVGDGISTWPSATGQPTDCLGQSVAESESGLDAGSATIVNRFFAKTSGSTGEPELYCEGAGRVGVAQPLVEGVERLRVRYWLAGVPQAVEAFAVAGDQWSHVVGVDLCAQVRGIPTGRPVRYVDCDGVPVLPADGRSRATFSRHVAVRNSRAASP
jgi:type IV pilus assembly protein PilW